MLWKDSEAGRGFGGRLWAVPRPEVGKWPFPAGDDCEGPKGPLWTIGGPLLGRYWGGFISPPAEHPL